MHSQLINKIKIACLSCCIFAIGYKILSEYIAIDKTFSSPIANEGTFNTTNNVPQKEKSRKPIYAEPIISSDSKHQNIETGLIIHETTIASRKVLQNETTLGYSPIEVTATLNNLQSLAANGKWDAFLDKVAFLGGQSQEFLEIAFVTAILNHASHDTAWAVINMGAKPSYSSLLASVKTENLALIELVLSLGVDINIENTERTSILASTLQSTENLKIIEYLLENGAELKPQIYQCEKDKLSESVIQLLEKYHIPKNIPMRIY